MSKLSQDSQAAIAAFLASKAPTQIAAAPAYGVDADADKARRKQARADRRAAERDCDDESASERYMEAVNDAYMSGGIAARDEAMSMGARAFRRY